MNDTAQLLVLSTSHKNSPIEVLDRFSVNEDQIRAFLDSVSEPDAPADEGTIVSTCNRTEFYLVTARPEGVPDWIAAWYPRGKGVEIDRGGWKPLRLANEEAAGHLMRVASGIESMVLGENQILAQVKTTLETLTASGHRFPIVTRLFQEAVHAGKTVRSETRLCQGAVSVSLAAVELTRKFFSRIDRRRILLVGAGETGSLVLRHFHAAGAWQIGVVNRSLPRAETLAREFGAKALPLGAIPRSLENTDIVVVATAAQEPLIWRDEVAAALRARSGKPLLMVDISTPRNIDPQVGRLPDVFLYNIENLKTIIDENMEKRRAEVPAAEKIIAGLQAHYWAWVKSLQVKPTIRKLSGFFDAIRIQELERVRHKVSEEEFGRLDRFSSSMIKKLLHHPIMHLRRMSNGELLDRDLIRSTWEMFQLDDTKEQGREHEEKRP